VAAHLVGKLEVRGSELVVAMKDAKSDLRGTLLGLKPYIHIGNPKLGVSKIDTNKR
jgi:hypothetical protein